MGARVIKIEPPGGEMWRKNGLPATGVDKRGEPFTVNFESINR
jgi:crotonobetainyl-CoA:carnitine CoA-transferase CaiB-like acyl-CoA transferase